MQILFWSELLSDKWDCFIQSCPMATFLHSRRFLAYHKHRFLDRSIIINQNNEWLAVMPAAENPQNTKQIISHPGSSFGGILHKGKVNGEILYELFKTIGAFYYQQGYESLRYKMVPIIYQQPIIQDDAYALFRCEAHLYRRDLSCAIDLALPSALSSAAQSTMRRRLRKAQNQALLISDDLQYLPSYWAFLTAHLKEKYQREPVHTFSEISQLIFLFPEKIKFRVALANDRVVAGMILFCDKAVMHTQYLWVGLEGKSCFALDFIIQAAMDEAKQKSFRYFDFGISNEREGQVLNQNLYLSKTKHGAFGVIHDFYHLDLAQLRA